MHFRVLGFLGCRVHGFGVLGCDLVHEGECNDGHAVWYSTPFRPHQLRGVHMGSSQVEEGGEGGYDGYDQTAVDDANQLLAVGGMEGGEGGETGACRRGS